MSKRMGSPPKVTAPVMIWVAAKKQAIGVINVLMSKGKMAAYPKGIKNKFHQIQPEGIRRAMGAEPGFPMTSRSRPHDQGDAISDAPP